MRYALFESGFGWVGVAGDSDGLHRTSLPQESRKAAFEALRVSPIEPEADPSFFGDLLDRLRQYFEGRPVAFPDRLAIPNCSPFKAALWRFTRSIPYGETRSYRWLAAQAGNPLACRAAGRAMAENPWPIVVPCHRVIGSAGDLRGFGGGLDMKRRLLELESRSLKLG
ncbi:MAG: methylated-DNA--[protein]-cysteine S-methyltransferase [Chloroflexi bacterium]|nr:methylated-DNA--[protein]-cysteine S-methyltransferase [Chloroflexota bacterium]